MNVAVVQARMGSTRLPGKVLMDVAGVPMLGRVVERVRRASRVDDVVVATTTADRDDAVVRYCEAEDVPVHRGSEDDVLDRYHQVAQSVDADAVTRIAADCPLHDPAVIDRVAAVYDGGDHDYVSNTLEPSYPVGLAAEVLSAAALETAWREAEAPDEREHVTPFIRRRPDRFRLASVVHDEDLSHHRWTVDEPADLELVRRVYDALGDGPFGMEEVLALLEERPELAAINAHVEQRKVGVGS